MVAASQLGGAIALLLFGAALTAASIWVRGRRHQIAGWYNRLYGGRHPRYAGFVPTFLATTLLVLGVLCVIFGIAAAFVNG